MVVVKRERERGRERERERESERKRETEGDEGYRGAVLVSAEDTRVTTGDRFA